MKRVFLTVIVLVIVAGATKAQLIRDFMNLTEESLIYNKSVVDMPDYTGKPFINKDFVKGSISSSDGITYENVPLRYNIYNDRFEYENDEKSFEVDPLKFGNSVNFDGRKFIYISHIINGISHTGYLEILESGNYFLYKRHKVRYDRPEPAGAYSDSKPGNFVTLIPEYFLQKSADGEIVYISGERKLLDLCGSRDEEIRSYIKDNKLKIKKEDDLKSLVIYMNNQ